MGTRASSCGTDSGGAGNAEGVRELAGIELRSFLTLQMIDDGRPVRVREMVAGLHQRGFAVAGRPSKVISDALRWEIARGRVVRIGRGCYRVRSRIPRTTLRRMRQRMERVASRPPAPLRSQPLRPCPRPLVCPDGPWRYRRRYGIARPPRTPWGAGIPRASQPEPTTAVARALRERRHRLDELRRAEPFGPRMV